METNFKVDVPSFALGFNTGKKKGGDKTVIDVPELPTERIEQDKIYRVVKDTDGSVEVYMATQPVDECFENFYKQMAGIDMSVNVVYYIVDTVPENPKAADMAGSNITMYLYILASTGEPYLSGPAGTAITIPEMMGVGHYAGIVTSVDEMTDGMGIYTIMTESGSSTIYGIPDEADNKTLYEHNGSEWVECKAGGPELNIAYGDTPPEDTTKLWVKTAEPNGVLISPEVEETEVDGVSCFELKETLPTALHSAGCAAVGSKIYIIGGTGRDEKAINAVTVYDTEEKTFKTYTGVLGSALTYVRATAIGTKIYLVGGGSSKSTTSTTIRCFDTESMTITTCATVLPTALRAVQCGAVGTDLYIMGGLLSSTAYQKTVYKYDTLSDDSIEEVGTLAMGAGFGDCTLVGTTFYIYANGNNPSIVTTFNVLTLTSTTFTLNASGKNYGLINGTGANFGDDYLYLFRHEEEIIRYDTITKTGELLATKSPFEAKKAAGATVGNKFYRFGGTVGGSSANTINDYDAINSASVFINASLVPLVNDGSLYVKPSTEENIFPIVKAGGMSVEIGVDTVYMGNAEGIGEPVEAALYKDGEWTTI